MPTVTIDRISLLEATERHGAVTRLVRQALVSGLETTDYQALSEALNEAGVPVAGATLAGFVNLVLTERNPRMIDKDKCQIDLTYEHFLNEGQDLETPIFGQLAGEISTNIQQKASNLDGDGNQIALSHTFSSTDKDYPNQTVTQGGEIQVYEPQKSLTIAGKLITARPWLIGDNITGHVNEFAWRGEPARTWMCTGANWRPLDKEEGANSYMLTFEFQHNPDTWDPTAVFIDDRTGKPPADLVVGTGIKIIEVADPVDFDEAIGSITLGA